MANFEEFVEATSSIATVEALSKAFGRALDSEGYQNHILTSIRNRSVGQVAWFEFPVEYPEIYLKEHWHEHDPILASSLRARRPFIWDRVSANGKISKKAAEVMHSCRELGVHSGIVFPMYGLGPEREVISISKQLSTDTDPRRLPLLHAICTQTWCKFLELSNVVEPVGIPQWELTPREREVLQWTKIGKSTAQIAEIMSISHRTAQHYIMEAMDKLGAPNRVAAVVIALQWGLLD